MNGGDPFGPAFELWRERSPAFTVDRLRTPIRLEGHGSIGSVIGNWEWYAELIFTGPSRRLPLFTRRNAFARQTLGAIDVLPGERRLVLFLVEERGRPRPLARTA